MSCVSVLSNNLTHGFNCGYRIEDIVASSGGGVRSGSSTTERELAAVSEYVLEVRERSLPSQREETHRLLEYLGLLVRGRPA